jgi:hypothetical protein
MTDSRISAITKPKGRKVLYHFTRVSNLPLIARFDALFSSHHLHPHGTGERRSKPIIVAYEDLVMTLNVHLRIPDSMIDPSTTQEQFRAALDRNVFFWPTLRDCQKMIETYARREPEEAFAVMTFDAYSLISNHASSVFLSKYDSGSSPRFPTNCSYRKSEAMFLPLHQFQLVLNQLVPAKSSEIKEVLIEEKVEGVSKDLLAIYVKEAASVPEKWRALTRLWEDLYIG